MTPPKPDFILGVDPGLGGALAIYDNRAPAPAIHCHAVYDMPVIHNKGSKSFIDPAALAKLVAELAWQHSGLVAAVEKVHSLPRQGGAFNFGLSTGVIHGVLAAHGVPMTLVSPVKWKTGMGLGRQSPDETSDTNKTRARMVAAKLFPTLADSFSRKKDDGRAEALLLAFYYAKLVEPC